MQESVPDWFDITKILTPEVNALFDRLDQALGKLFIQIEEKNEEVWIKLPENAGAENKDSIESKGLRSGLSSVFSVTAGAKERIKSDPMDSLSFAREIGVVVRDENEALKQSLCNQMAMFLCSQDESRLATLIGMDSYAAIRDDGNEYIKTVKAIGDDFDAISKSITTSPRINASSTNERQR